jgi:hypothetical protein
MEPNDLPIVCIPLDLPNEAAASLVEFFENLTEAIQRHYFSQLHRLYHRQHEEDRDPEYSPVRSDPNPDPPF